MTAPLFRARVCVLDTETTGFQHVPWSRVVELAGVVLDCDGTEVDHFTALVNPDILDERAAGALAVNGLTVEMIRGGCDTYGVVQSFQGWLNKHECRFLTAYNVKFDQPMVERMGLRGPRWASCVMERAKKHLRELPGVTYPGGSLAAVAAHLGIPFDGPAHRALTDARVAAGIAIAIRRRELAAAAT